MELIKITTNDKNQQVVSAKELYLALGFDKSQWSRWSKQNIIENPFSIKDEDWVGFDIMSNGNQTVDYALTLDFAKRISMMAKTEKGEQVRVYFIECEKQLKEQTAVKLPTFLETAKALVQSLEENEKLKEQALIDKPKVDFYDEVVTTTSSFDFQETSAMLKLTYGRNTLFKKLREAGVLMEDNLPYRKYIDSGYLLVVESKWTNPKTSTCNAVKQTRCTQKGLEWLLKNKVKFNL